ncbi:hypothetical protein [Actinoplanes sp. NPDC026619]|uniref:hypothetical protein n=1 Tax=Actinoplanes sp. NPDC026619 TaxID=3155798 RepID=UPI0033CDC482
MSRQPPVMALPGAAAAGIRTGTASVTGAPPAGRSSTQSSWPPPAPPQSGPKEAPGGARSRTAKWAASEIPALWTVSARVAVPPGATVPAGSGRSHCTSGRGARVRASVADTWLVSPPEASVTVGAQVSPAGRSAPACTCRAIR